MPRLAKDLQQQYIEAVETANKLQIQYVTQLYFETMPEYDPVYKYCFTTSNRTIPNNKQCFDGWIRAVMKHMATRSDGHGGAYTDAELVSIPIGLSDAAIEQWLKWINKTLRAKAKKKQQRKPA